MVLATVLAVLVPSAAAEPPPLEHDPEDVRELADDILGRDEFQPPERSLLERIGDWIEDLLGGEGGSGAEGAEAAPGTGGSSPITVVLFVLAVAAVGYLAYHLLRHPGRRRDPEVEDPAIEVERHRGPREWVADAERAEAEGRWKDGLRCRFRALVEQLVEDRIVPELVGRTSGELRADVAAAAPGAAGAFDEAADLFDRAWYGDLPTGAAEAERFTRDAELVLAAGEAAP